MARKIRFEAVYPYPREQVWIALTDPVAMAEWLMPNDFVPTVGHRFNFRTKPAPGFDGVVHAEVLEVEPPARLSYSWLGGGIDTIVSWHLKEEAGNTRLVLEQSGFRGIKGFMISKILGGGWKRMVAERLPAAAGRVVGGTYVPDPGAPESQCH